MAGPSSSTCPGLGNDRETSTSLAQNLASHGYVVVTVDHIHDASEVELADGQLVTSAILALTPANELAMTTKAIESKAADTSFILDQLAAINHGKNPGQAHQPLPHGLSGALDLNRVGMFGQSQPGDPGRAAARPHCGGGRQPARHHHQPSS